MKVERMNLKTNFATKGERIKKQWMKVVSCDWVLCVCVDPATI